MRSRGDHQVVPEEFAPLITGKSFGNCYSRVSSLEGKVGDLRRQLDVQQCEISHLS